MSTSFEHTGYSLIPPGCTVFMPAFFARVRAQRVCGNASEIGKFRTQTAAPIIQSTRQPGASNKSGVKGVSKDSNGKWHAYIGIDGRLHSLGRFEALDEAAATRVAAERELFGEFARCA